MFEVDTFLQKLQSPICLWQHWHAPRFGQFDTTTLVAMNGVYGARKIQEDIDSILLLQKIKKKNKKKK